MMQPGGDVGSPQMQQQKQQMQMQGGGEGGSSHGSGGGGGSVMGQSPGRGDNMSDHGSVTSKMSISSKGSRSNQGNIM